MVRIPDRYFHVTVAGAVLLMLCGTFGGAAALLGNSVQSGLRDARAEHVGKRVAMPFGATAEVVGADLWGVEVVTRSADGVTTLGRMGYAALEAAGSAAGEGDGR